MNVTFKMKLKLTQYKSLINIVTNNISQQTWTIRRNSNCSKAGNGMQNSKDEEGKVNMGQLSLSDAASGTLGDG